MNFALSRVASAAKSALKAAASRPAIAFALALAVAVGAMYWRLQAKEDALKDARAKAQAKVQQNRALRDSLEKDTTVYEEGILQRIYSRTGFVGEADTSAPEAVTSGGREVERSTGVTYESDSVSAEGKRKPAPQESPQDTLQYDFRTQAGRYGLEVDLSVWPNTGRLDYRFGIDPPAVDIRLYQTRRLEGQTPVTETHVVVPSGRATSMRSVRSSASRKQKRSTGGGPWSYGAAVSLSPGAISIGPRLDYQRGPLYMSMSAGYAPDRLTITDGRELTGSIELGVMF